jgi:hypothetical protein
MNFLNSITYYYIEIQITKVNKKLKFPLQPYIFDKEQSKQYINDLENKKFVVDKITLEELINYQNIEFNIIRGYYFNEGFNDKIKICIEYLFNKRLELKNKKNPAEVLYKLLINQLGKIPTSDEIKISSNSSKTSASTFDFPTTERVNLVRKLCFVFSKPLSSVSFLSFENRPENAMFYNSKMFVVSCKGN